MNVVFLRMDQIYKEIIKIVPYELIKLLMCLLLLSDVWWYFSKQNIFEYWVNSSDFFDPVQFLLNFHSIEWKLSGIYIKLNENWKEIECKLSRKKWLVMGAWPLQILMNGLGTLNHFLSIFIQFLLNFHFNSIQFPFDLMKIKLKLNSIEKQMSRPIV